MAKINENQTILDIINLLLETKDYNLLYEDRKNGQEYPLDTRYLFDLFISGMPAQQTIVSLLQLNPALKDLAAEPQSMLFKTALRQFVSIFDSLHDGVLIADANEIVRYINKSFERISGAKFDNLVGQELVIARPGAKLGGVIRSGKPLLGVKRKFGDIEYMTDMHPVIINGVCIGGITIARDITEIQQLQTKLSKYRIRYNDLLRQVKTEHTATYTFEDIIGTHPVMQQTKSLAQKLASSSIPVLIRGESGVGKELFAHAIHLASKRAKRPFVTVNCAAIPGPLLESELFGYTEGAFSGAKAGGKQGLVALAHTGTLFLDEIGDMDIELQVKLLRAIHSGEIQPLGSEKTVKVDLRFIAVTNANLEKKISEGKFREDLFYRLNASQIVVPPLREHKEDIVSMANFFLQKYFVDHPLSPLALSPKTQEIFTDFPWPGNVRELENTINFIGSITEQQIISSNCLPPIFYESNSKVLSMPTTAFHHVCDAALPECGNSISLKEAKYHGEKDIIMAALEKYGSNLAGKKKVAKELGISLTTLYGRINILKIK